MIARMLADLVVLVHLAFIGFVTLGGLLALRWRWVPWLHLPAVGWGALVEFFGLTCPLTPLEITLRQAAGDAGYSGDFLGHYIAALLYPEGLTRALQISLGAFVILVNICIYAVVVRRVQAERRASGKS